MVLWRIIGKKYEDKMMHLRTKYKDSEEDSINKIPEVMKDLNLEN